MSISTSPPPISGTLPQGATVVTKNDFFTYIKADKNTKPHRAAIQVWNVQFNGWDVTIGTGGTYMFPDKTGTQKKETNNFHKKHLVTLNAGGTNTTLDTKATALWKNRITEWDAGKQARNVVRTQVMNSFKVHDKTGASANAATWYGDAGYGPKPTVDTLTVIDCSQFGSWADLAADFAAAFKPAMDGTAPKVDEFTTGNTWHPFVTFGVDCVYEIKNSILQAMPVYNRCQIAAHLVKVAPNRLEVQVYHMAKATS